MTQSGLISYEYYKHSSYYYYKITFSISVTLGTVAEYDDYVIVPVTIKATRTARSSVYTSKKRSTKGNTSINVTINNLETGTIPAQSVSVSRNIIFRNTTALTFGTYSYKIPRPTGDHPETVGIYAGGNYVTTSASSSSSGGISFAVGSVTIAPYVPPTPTGVKLPVKVSGAWVDGEPKVKVNGAWIDVDTLFIKENGTWIQVN